MAEPSSTIDCYAEPYRHETRIRRRRVTPLWALTVAEGLKALRNAMPGATRQLHIELAHAHRQRRLQQQERWRLEADAAAMEHFGRPFAFGDYRVSAIGQDGFTEARKASLRDAAHRSGHHGQLAVLHWMAAGHRHASALRFLHDEPTAAH